MEGEVSKLTGLTKAEKDVLSAFIRYKSITKAAGALGISVQLASARKQRATAKYLKAKYIVEEYERFRMQAPSILGV